MRTTVTATILAAALAGCAGETYTRGNLVEDRDLAELAVGASTAQDVLAVLGTPTTVAAFDDRTWYYIGQRTEHVSFFEPEIIDRRVVIVSFDEQGRLTAMDERTLEDGQEVEFVSRQTPTLGREMTFLEQMLGNIGRFNPGTQE